MCALKARSTRGGIAALVRASAVVHTVALVAFAALLPTAALAEDDEGYTHEWSTTLTTDFQVISDPWATNSRGDFFDQYQWTPNKSSSLPVELGIRDAFWDVIAPDHSRVLQFRLRSPTSNLGVSGSQVDQPFLNQRADLLARFGGIETDLSYWRFRTESLRLFPTTVGRPYIDETAPDDRFTRDRTGFETEVRLRVRDRWPDTDYQPARLFDPELSVRGGYDWRPAERQNRFLLRPANDWIGFTQPQDENVAKVGGGLLLVPGGLFTLAFDVDYKRFTNEPTILQEDVAPGVPPATRTVGFIPDTDLTVGTLRLQGDIGERVGLEGGFQVKRLQQVGELTPAQQAAGLTDNELIYYAANASGDLRITERWSANAWLTFDQRDNQLQRDTSLFSPSNGTQVGPFFDQWNRIYTGAEIAFEPVRRNVIAVGAKFEWIDRDLQFVPPITPNPAILAPNALIGPETKMWTVYARTRLRPLRGLNVSAELGYRGAPATAYRTDLDDYVYGRLKASYVVPLSRPILLSAFLQGGTGENRQQSVVDGVGPVPVGARTPLSFERSDYLWGITASTAPWRRLSVFASFFCGQDAQDYGLVLSSLQRYVQTTQPIFFTPDGIPTFRNRQRSFIVGLQSPLLESSDAGISYAYTGAEATYGAEVPSGAALATAATRIVDANIHRLQFEAGHWLRDGLRVLVGYRLQLLDDDAPVPTGSGSVVPALPLSMTQHTITLGVTLTSELLERDE